MKRYLHVVVIASLIVTSIGTVSASQITSAQSKKNSIDSKINAIESLKKREKNNLNQTKDLIEAVQNEQMKKDTKKKELESQKNVETHELKTTGDQLKDAEEKYNQTFELFKARLRSLYMKGDQSLLEAVALSENIVEFMNRYELLNQVAKRDKEIIRDLAIQKKDLEFKKSKKEEEVRLIHNKIVEYSNELGSLKNSKEQLEKKVKSINFKLLQLENEEDELLRESKKLASLIRSLQSSNTKYSGGIMKWPVPSSTNITSQFGMRYHPVLKYNRMHTGIDIGASHGVSIVATNSGVVKLASWSGGYGNTVVIDHGGGISTLYGHCSVLLVKEGAKVNAGDTIAKVGSTGISTGPHLHFEVRKNGDPVNPMSYYGK